MTGERELEEGFVFKSYSGKGGSSKDARRVGRAWTGTVSGGPKCTCARRPFESGVRLIVISPIWQPDRV